MKFKVLLIVEPQLRGGELRIRNEINMLECPTLNEIQTAAERLKEITIHTPLVPLAGADILRARPSMKTEGISYLYTTLDRD